MAIHKATENNSDTRKAKSDSGSSMHEGVGGAGEGGGGVDTRVDASSGGGPGGSAADKNCKEVHLEKASAPPAQRVTISL